MALAALVAVWMLMCSQMQVCPDGACNAAGPASVCLCICHAVSETPPSFTLNAHPVKAVRPPDYVPPHSMAVMPDIFRPPLANS
ncbi:MAG: hypothetical protein LBW77_05765 [Verrucomicrobiota bacterium]|jgi:hypothetical protein|nr:hypothetical protein [Verrucomicrobiota bacterium]